MDQALLVGINKYPNAPLLGCTERTDVSLKIHKQEV